MTEAIIENLGGDICAYTSTELKRELKKLPRIKYYVEDKKGA
jgi:hypothetical protein